MNLLRLATLLPVVLIAVSCSSDSNNAPQKSSVSKNFSGVIKSVSNGTVQVGDVTLDTTNTKVTIEGTESDDQDLKVGMMVDVSGEIDDDGKNGVADEIEYDDEIEGAVTANNIAANGTLEVMGQVVKVTATTIIEGVASAADFIVGTRVEVSGEPNVDGIVVATRIELEDESENHAGEELENEVDGHVSSLDETAKSFKIGKLTVKYASATVEGTLANDVEVEVISSQVIDMTDPMAPVLELIAADKVMVEIEMNHEHKMGSMEHVDHIPTTVIPDPTPPANI